MYMAKAHGKSRLVRVRRRHGRGRQERAWRSIEDLRAALRRGQLRVHYQPTVSLADGVTTGYEALLRWQHPDARAGPAGRVHPARRGAGQIVAIGDWVLA